MGDADVGHGEVVTLLTEAEWEAAARRALSRVGLTYPELRAQAVVNHFTSTEARKLWLMIGGTLPG